MVLQPLKQETAPCRREYMLVHSRLRTQAASRAVVAKSTPGAESPVPALGWSPGILVPPPS